MLLLIIGYLLQALCVASLVLMVGCFCASSREDGFFTGLAFFFGILGWTAGVQGGRLEDRGITQLAGTNIQLAAKNAHVLAALVILMIIAIITIAVYRSSKKSLLKERKKFTVGAQVVSTTVIYDPVYRIAQIEELKKYLKVPAGTPGKIIEKSLTNFTLCVKFNGFGEFGVKEDEIILLSEFEERKSAPRFY